MKRGLLLLAVTVAAGCLAFFLTRSQKMQGSRGALLDSTPELSWLRADLKLTDEQFAKVSEVHAAYRPKCLEMCGQISEAHEKIEAAASGIREVTPELEAAIEEHAEIHARCQKAMLKHIYETAALLEREQASRYLETMLPYALDFAPAEAGNLHSR